MLLTNLKQGTFILSVMRGCHCTPSRITVKLAYPTSSSSINVDKQLQRVSIKLYTDTACMVAQGVISINCHQCYRVFGQFHASRCSVQTPLGEVHSSMPMGLLGMSSMNVGKHHLFFPTRYSLEKKIHLQGNLLPPIQIWPFYAACLAFVEYKYCCNWSIKMQSRYGRIISLDSTPNSQLYILTGSL